jgi:hypothetical protein
MNANMITMSTRPEHKMVTAHMSGLLTVAEVHQFQRDEEQAIRSMGCQSGEYVVLIDTAGSVIQTQEVVAALQDLVENGPFKAKRTAVVRPTSLARMQAKRILNRDSAMIFNNVEEAESWLLSTDGDARNEAG